MSACQACGAACPPGERLCLKDQQLHRGPARQVELLEHELEVHNDGQS